MLIDIKPFRVYSEQTYLDMRKLVAAMGLDIAHFDNIMMNKKAVGPSL